MKLKELVSLMNIYEVELASHSIRDLMPPKRLDMLHLATCPLMLRYGDHDVEQITNIARLGITIWIN